MNALTLVRTVVIVAVVAALSGLTAQAAKARPWPWINPQIADSGNYVSGADYGSKHEGNDRALISHRPGGNNGRQVEAEPPRHSTLRKPRIDPNRLNRLFD